MERQRKRELRDLNLRVWNGEKDVLSVQGHLDSSMKKNTAFIRRLRTTINPAGLSTFLQEIRTLSLERYLSEMVSACFEGLCKLKVPAEIAAGVEIVSALHQRFGPKDFTCYLGWHLGRGLSTPDKAQWKALAQDVRDREERERIARQRILLRVATELWLVGVLRSLEDVSLPQEAGKVKDTGRAVDAPSKAKINGLRMDTADPEPFPLEVLKDTLSHDREHINLPLVVLFVKTFAWDILGSRSTKTEVRKTAAETGPAAVINGMMDSATSTEDEESSAAADTPLASPALQQRFKNVLTRYFEDVKAHMVRDQKQLFAQGRRNAEAYVKSGEVFEDRQANHEKALKAQEKLVSSAQTLADALVAEMPDLSEKETDTSGFAGGVGMVKTGEYLRGHGEGVGIWEDEEERRFYEKLIDLKDRVPGILLEDGKKKKPEEDAQVGKKADENTEPADKVENRATEGDDQSTTIMNKTVGAQVDALLSRLTELSTRDQVDQFAIDFCFLNSKASRNRLIKSLQDIPKGRTDLLPLFARLIATLGKFLADISQGVVAYLDEEFRSLQRRKTKDFLGQVRMVNIRYIAEMTKFGVVPEHVIFHTLKVSLDDFSRMNIEIISSLLENCGRYLLRNPDTSPRMTSFMETLQRKKGAQHFGQQERMLIENAMYYVNPPERAAIEQKERTSLDLFVRKLIYLDLGKKTLEKTIRQIRRLHWEETEVFEIMRKIFSKPGRIKFSNVHLLAVMLKELYRYHADFVILVLDELLEKIAVGLDVNDFKYNQRRIAEVKYLGELYNYKVIDSSMIFDTLYKILNYGHTSGYARPDAICHIDLPDDYFRVRLVCSLLETCGTYYNRDQAKKKLDFFLTFFQYYIHTKDPMPMDMDFVVSDMFALLRPQWKIATNLADASKDFADACKQNYQGTNAAMNRALEPEPEPEHEEVDDGDLSDDERGPAGADKRELVNGEAEEGEDAANLPNGASQDAGSDDEEEHIVVTRPEEQRDPEADAEFDRELAKLMAESVESRKYDRKATFDVPLPMRRPVRENHVANDSDGDSPAPVEPSNTMKFALLSKKGNKQQTRSIDLPSDSTFAVAMRTQQEAERAEQQRIKNLVLNYELNSEDQHDGDSAFHYQLSPNRNRIRLVGKGMLNQALPLPERHSTQRTSSYHRRPQRFTQQDRSSSGISRSVSSPNSSPALLSNPVQVPSKIQVTFTDAPDTTAAFDNPHAQPRLDKSGGTRSKQRARKLQLSELDWYGHRSTHASSVPPPQNLLPLDSFIKEDKSKQQSRQRDSSIMLD